VARKRRVKRKRNFGNNLGFLLVIVFIGVVVFLHSSNLFGSKSSGPGQIESSEGKATTVVETQNSAEESESSWKNGVFNPPEKKRELEQYMKAFDIIEGVIVPKGSTLEKEKSLKPWDVKY
jgi:hypothetical protein